MREPITTTANQVKKGGYWCEDATAITQAALQKDGLGWDDEIPVSWGFENLGLANTILALGSVRPKYQARADTIVVKLMRELYRLATELGSEAGFTFTQTGHWLGNPDRAVSRKAQCQMWKHISGETMQPANKAIADALTILFGTDPNHVCCIHASKLLLFACLRLKGQVEAVALRKHLINFLTKELENG
jgi:hypothetical protein